jgi:hypothetical protein
MLIKSLIDLREIYIKIFKKKILMIEKNNQIISNKYVIYLINLFYFFLIDDLLKINKINTIYELDEIIFYNNNKINEIYFTQIMLDFDIIDPSNDNYNENITEKIKKYSKNIPFYIIIKIERININLSIKIKLMNINKILIRYFKIINILDKTLCELLI